MTPDEELVLVFAALHLVALSLGAVLFWMFMHSETVRVWQPPDEDDGGGGGGNDRRHEDPKGPPPGGIPLPDAEQSRERFRAPGRLAKRHGPAPRRPEHAPETPRVPSGAP